MEKHFHQQKALKEDVEFERSYVSFYGITFPLWIL